MTGELEKLAYEEARRALDKQEQLLEEMRARTGMLIAASSLAASFLGPQAFLQPGPRSLVFVALTAFVLTLGTSVFLLLPKKSLAFSTAGGGVYKDFYGIREDMAEVYRQLAYGLDEYWKSNEGEMVRLGRAFALASGALIAEILSLAVLLGASLI
jgi:hypothetical protein